MPRTKQARKKSSIISRAKQSSTFVSKATAPTDMLTSLVCKNYKSIEHIMEDVNTCFDNAICRQQQVYEMAKKHMVKVIWDDLKELPDAVIKSNVHSAIDVGMLKKQEDNKNLDGDSRTRTNLSVKPFEFKRPKSTLRKPLRSSSRKQSSLSSKCSDLFKTPLMKRRLTPGSVIMPKIQCNTPMTVMRRPQLGEVAVSVSGSPLLVRPFAAEDVPTVNVPLPDGRVFSIMPEDGSFLDVPFDEETKQHLRTLRAHLEILAAD